MSDTTKEIYNSLRTMYEEPDVFEDIPGNIVEVRLFDFDKKTYSGYFDDFKALAKEITPYEESGKYSGIYITLNNINSDSIKGTRNKIIQSPSKTTKDDDIENLLWLPIDFDPVRKSGTSSTDDQKTKAFEISNKVCRYLTDNGFPEPIKADSGNGAHLLYKLNNNSPNTSEKIKALLLHLREKFPAEDTDVDIDRSVYNPSRIFKLYGTTARKGNPDENTHRKSHIISVPEKLTSLMIGKLNKLIKVKSEKKTTKKQGKKESPGVDINNLFNGDLKLKNLMDGNIDEYGFKSSSEAEMSLVNKFVYYNLTDEQIQHQMMKCKIGKWQDSPDAYKKMTIDKARQRIINKSDDIPAIPVEDKYSPQIFEAAKEILNNGNAFDYIFKKWSKMHVGDEAVGKLIMCAIASTMITNTKGLHIKPSGKSGSGKSDAVESMLKLYPQDKVCSGSISGKALFYMKHLQPGSIVFSDDVDLGEDLITTIKQATSKYQKSVNHFTVSVNRQAQELTIPERVCWFLTSVDGFDDEQMNNRFLTMDVDPSESQDREVFARQVKYLMEDDNGFDNIDDETNTCRAIFDILGAELYKINIPIADAIDWERIENRRNFFMFIDIVRTFTVFNKCNREKFNGGYLSTPEDFELARKVYVKIEETNTSNLTNNEILVRDAIFEAGAGCNRKTIQDLTGLSNGNISHIINGRNGNAGLLKKVPALSIEKASVPVYEDVNDDGERKFIKNRHEDQYTLSYNDNWEQYSMSVGINASKIEASIAKYKRTHAPDGADNE